jgi:hypothetical protein
VSLFASPQKHAANPPRSWTVVKVGEERWQLRAGTDVLDTFPTRHAAMDARTTGRLVGLYDKERRWYAGEPVPGWKPYTPRPTPVVG